MATARASLGISHVHVELVAVLYAGLPKDATMHV